MTTTPAHDLWADPAQPDGSGITAADLKTIVWRLDTHAGHWLPPADLTAVTAWMRDNAMPEATAAHPVTVEHGQITYGRDRSPSHVRATHRKIETVTVPLRTAPPTVWQPSCDDATLKRVHSVIDAHEWVAAFGGICVDCTPTFLDRAGRICGRRDDAVPWPCQPVREVFAAAGFPVPPPAPGQPVRVLGDGLSQATHDVVFGSVGTEL